MNKSKLQTVLNYLENNGSYLIDQHPDFHRIYSSILNQFKVTQSDNFVETRTDKILYLQKIKTEYLVVAYDNKFKNKYRKSLLMLNDINIFKLLKDYEYTCKKNLQYVNEIYKKMDFEKKVLTDELVDLLDENCVNNLVQFIYSLIEDASRKDCTTDSLIEDANETTTNVEISKTDTNVENNVSGKKLIKKLSDEKIESGLVRLKGIYNYDMSNTKITTSNSEQKKFHSETLIKKVQQELIDSTETIINSEIEICTKNDTKKDSKNNTKYKTSKNIKPDISKNINNKNQTTLKITKKELPCKTENQTSSNQKSGDTKISNEKIENQIISDLTRISNKSPVTQDSITEKKNLLNGINSLMQNKTKRRKLVKDQMHVLYKKPISNLDQQLIDFSTNLSKSRLRKDK